MRNSEYVLDNVKEGSETCEVTRSRCWVFFFVFLLICTCLTTFCREEIQQPVFAAIDALEFPELYDESIPALTFLRSLNKLLLASGIKDFSMRDLHKPDAQRLRRNLSAIINFAKFREEKLTAYTELQEGLESLIVERDAIADENAALMAELNTIKEAQAAELPEVERLEKETETVFQENHSLHKQQAALSSEVRGIKQQVNVLTDEASQLRYKLSQARSTGEDLRLQIVHSPQRIKAVLEEIGNAVERERAATSDAEKRSRELAARLEVATKVERDVEKSLSLMEEAENEIKNKKEISQKVKALRAEVADAEHEASQLAATHQHLKRQQAALMDRIDRVRAQCEVKKQAAEGRVEEQLRNKEAIEAENAAAVAKLAENEAAIRSYQDHIMELRETHEHQIGQVLDQYQTLREAVARYHKDMEAAMEGKNLGQLTSSLLQDSTFAPANNQDSSELDMSGITKPIDVR